MNYTPDQIAAINGITDLLLDPTSHKSAVLAVLTGAAGTGKTTVIGQIMNAINKQKPHIPISLCATTHRAAEVLENIVHYPVSTGHALFKLRPSISKHGKEILKRVGICEIPFESIVILDESSMIGNKFLEAIVDIVQYRNLKVLFVGDYFQLPPPQDACSIFDGSLATFPLTTVHRQALGNPILAKATEFVEHIKGGPKPTIQTILNTKGEGIHVLPHSEFVSKFVERYIDYTTGAPVDIPLCTYTNDSSINYNSMIRKAAYFLEEDSIKPYYPGERLISNNVVLDGEHTILTNNEAIHVLSYIETEKYAIPGYTIKVKGDYCKHTGTDTKTVFAPQSKAIAENILAVHRETAKKANRATEWHKFYQIKNSLADLRPPFAGTTHKAQGGTFPAVFIDKLNIDKCRDAITKARLFYVALTRATTNVYINS